MRRIRKSPVVLELERIEKEERRMEKRALARKEPRWKELAEEKIPPLAVENLKKAFTKAFGLVFEKGNVLIERTYRKEELQKEFQIRDYALELKGSRKELKKFRSDAAGKNLKNMAVSAAEGVGLGLLGIGLPDIAVFVGMLLRGTYETALDFGFSYDTPEERLFILCLLEASVSRGEQWKECNSRADRMLPALRNGEMGDEPVAETERKLEEQLLRTGNAFAMDMLAAKFIQGLPLVGVLGGLSNPVYYRRILSYVQLKYRKRYLLGKTG